MRASRSRPSAPPARARERHRGLVDDLAPGGDGVLHVVPGQAANMSEGRSRDHRGRLPDDQRRAVFVRGVAHGDEVLVDVDFGQRPARGTLLQILAPSPDRVEPPCEHVRTCGGCDWMHLSADAQERGHLDHVRRALRALPEDARTRVLAEVPIGYTRAHSPLGYRTRSRLHAHASGGRAIVAMHAAGGRDAVEIERCVVVAPALDAARQTVADMLAGAHGQGDVQLALGAGGKPVVELRWSGSLPPASFARAEASVTAGELAGLRLWTRGVDRPATIGDPAPRGLGPDGSEMRLSAGGFAQAATAMNTALAGRVAELAGAGSGVELYSGSGNLSVLLARGLAPLVCVESDGAACVAARENLKLRGLTAKVVEADAAGYDIARATDVVVLDPPRTGARDACARLAAKPPKRVVYVSCDPPTLGRDLAILVAGGFAVTSMDVFEMFPQTSHVETVVALARTRPAGKA